MQHLLRFAVSPALLNFGQHFLDRNFLFRSDRLECFSAAASDIGDASEQMAANLSAGIEGGIQEILDQHLRDLLSRYHPAHSFAISRKQFVTE